MKKIKLTQNKFALVDDEDFIFLNKYNWHTRTDSVSGISYAGRRENGTYVHMHRLILGEDNLVGFFVDHKDGNGLNNQSNNIRPATRQENMRNRKVMKNNTTGFRGVSYRKNRNAFIARANIGKSTYLGYFKTAIEASKVYESFIKSEYGEFHRQIN